MTRYTNANLNSQAKVIYAILSQPHWFLQLQTAENILSDREEAIAKNQIVLQKERALSELKQAKIKDLSDEERIELTAELALLKLDLEKHEILLRDAVMERDEAARIRDEIVAQHPEVQQDYLVNQDKFSQEALAATIARKISTDLLSRSLGIAPGAIDSLIGLTLELTKLKERIIQEHEENLNRFFANQREFKGYTTPENLRIDTPHR